jgi:hypothetical protein
MLLFLISLIHIGNVGSVGCSVSSSTFGAAFRDVFDVL